MNALGEHLLIEPRDRRGGARGAAPTADAAVEAGMVDAAIIIEAERGFQPLVLPAVVATDRRHRILPRGIRGSATTAPSEALPRRRPAALVELPAAVPRPPRHGFAQLERGPHAVLAGPRTRNRVSRNDGRHAPSSSTLRSENERTSAQREETECT